MEQDLLIKGDLEKRPMLIRKAILWGVVFIASVWFFFWGIPVNYMVSASTLLTIIGSLIITISWMMLYFVCTFLIFPGKKDNSSAEGYVVFALILGAFFGSAVLMIKQQVDRESQELVNYGVITEATVVDGSSFATRKIDLTKIKLVFTMEDGEEYTSYQRVSNKDFDRFYEGQKMTLVYSSRHPEMGQILYRLEDIERYKQLISDRKK